MRFSFLIYVPRSGSTLLARQISERIADVVVMPEFRTPEWLLSRREKLVVRMQPEDLFALIQLDHQRASLGLTDKEYMQVCVEMAGAGPRRILERLVIEYLRRQDQSSLPTNVLIKLGSLVNLIPVIHEAFPAALVLHIVRDPRGVTNSRINNSRPYFPNERMGRGDAWYSAKSWRIYQQKVARLRDSGFAVHDISYERLNISPGDELTRVANIMGLPYVSHGDANKVRPKVHDPEEAIHRRTLNPPQACRNEAWRTEMSRVNGCTVEYVTGSALIGAGYKPHYAQQNRYGYFVVAVILGYLIHLYLVPLYYSRRAIYYLTRWDRLIARLRSVNRYRSMWAKLKNHVKGHNKH